MIQDMASFGVAAHEVGHAIQHAQAYLCSLFAPHGFLWQISGRPFNDHHHACFLLGGAQTATGTSLSWLGNSLDVLPFSHCHLTGRV